MREIDEIMFIAKKNHAIKFPITIGILDQPLKQLIAQKEILLKHIIQQTEAFNNAEELEEWLINNKNKKHLLLIPVQPKSKTKKFTVSISDWGTPILETNYDKADDVITCLNIVSAEHIGAIAIVSVFGDSITIDFAGDVDGDLQDYEKIILKFEKQALKKKQAESAKKTNEILKVKNPNHYKEAITKRWANKKTS